MALYLWLGGGALETDMARSSLLVSIVAPSTEDLGNSSRNLW
jgi:hypothetical protein